MDQFVKRTEYIGGRAIPALQIGPAYQTQGTRGDGRPVLQTLAECISLRETNPLDADGNEQPTRQYLTITTENLRFTPPRFDTVVGLDVDEHGAELTLPVLIARMGENIAERQVQFAATRPAPAAPVSLADALAAEAQELDTPDA